MARSLPFDTESDVIRGVAMGLAFLVGLALNLDPERRVLALAVFGGGAVAFFGLAGLAAIDDEYAGPQLRWYLFAAWGVLLFSVGVWTESAVSGIGGIVVAVYASIRAWLFDALDDSEVEEEATVNDEPWDDPEAIRNTGDDEHPAARNSATSNRTEESPGADGADKASAKASETKRDEDSQE